MEKGQKMTTEQRKRVSEGHKGQTPWNKGKTGVYSKKSLKRFSEAKLRNPTKYWLGKERDFSTRLKISENRKGITARENHPNWQGGLTAIHKMIRLSFEYKEWRRSVFKRDGFKCIWCNKKGPDIEADHIKPFALHPDLRFDINNGRTLCKSCHKKTDTWGRKKIYI